MYVIRYCTINTNINVKICSKVLCYQYFYHTVDLIRESWHSDRESSNITALLFSPRWEFDSYNNVLFFIHFKVSDFPSRITSIVNNIPRKDKNYYNELFMAGIYRYFINTIYITIRIPFSWDVRLYVWWFFLFFSVSLANVKSE